MGRSRCLYLAMLCAVIGLVAVLGGCAVSSEPPPEVWEKVTLGQVSGARTANLYVGTYYLDAHVRLAWILSGPRNPHVTLALKIVNVRTGNEQVSAVEPPTDTLPRRDDHALGFVEIDPGEYAVYFIQRFRRGQGLGYDVAFTLFTRADANRP